MCVHFLHLTLNRHGLNEVHCFFCIEQKCCDQNKTFFFHSHGCCKAVGIRSPWPLTSSVKLFTDWMGSSNLVHTSLKTFSCREKHSRVVANLWGPLCLNLLVSLSQNVGIYWGIIQYFIGRRGYSTGIIFGLLLSCLRSNLGTYRLFNCLSMNIPT